MSTCILCDSGESEVLVAHGRDYEYDVPFEADVERCTLCGLAWQSPKPTWGQLPGFYPPDYSNYSPPSSLIARGLVRITEYLEARQVKALVGDTGRILDVGCGSGHYFETLRPYGDWVLEGTDISEHAAGRAIANGYRVHIGELENLDIPDGRFDMVRMSHLLEHVINPISTSRRAWELLKPGGYLVLETPNISCPDFLVFRRYWGALHLPRHIHFFNGRTMRRMLEDVGFPKTRLCFTLMTTGWALSVQNWLMSRWKLALTNGRMSGYSLLLVGFLPILLVQKALRVSTMMRAIARKA